MEFLQYLSAGAHESLSLGDTPTEITAAIKKPTSGEFKNQSAIGALVTVEDNAARFTEDGTTTPTNTNGTSADTGHLISAGQTRPVEGAQSVSNFSILDAVSGATAVVKVTTYFRR